MIAFLPVLLWAQTATVPSPSWPTLSFIITGFATVCILFVLRAVIESRDKTRAIWTAIYGEKDAAIKNGLVRDSLYFRDELGAFATRLDLHIAGDDSWRSEASRLAVQRNTELHLRLLGIEERLPAKPKRRIV
jgi:hypothetical protein